MRRPAGRLLSPSRPATRTGGPRPRHWARAGVVSIPASPPRGLGSPQAKQASPSKLSPSSSLLIHKYNVCSSFLSQTVTSGPGSGTQPSQPCWCPAWQGRRGQWRWHSMSSNPCRRPLRCGSRQRVQAGGPTELRAQPPSAGPRRPQSSRARGHPAVTVWGQMLPHALEGSGFLQLL